MISGECLDRNGFKLIFKTKKVIAHVKKYNLR